MPTATMNASRALISFKIWEAIISSREESERFSKKVRVLLMERAVTWWMLSPSTVTARISGFNRAPWQAGQGRVAMNCSIS